MRGTTTIRPWPGRVLAALIGIHILLAVARLPDKALGRRAEQLGQIRREGHAMFLLDKLGPAGREAAAIVEHLRAHTPADAIVLYRGEWRGLCELLGPLLYPRLLYRADAVAPEVVTVHGRPLARAPVPGTGVGAGAGAGPEPGKGVVVLVQDAATQRVSLELR